MLERPKAGEIAILVCVRLKNEADAEEISEFEELARAAGVQSVSIVTGSRVRPDARLYIGSGKAEEVKAQVDLHKAEVVLFNHTLSPSQERNLEELLECRVLDRTGLILDIFAQRARSFEGKLQVELAQLQHLSTRLVRGWTHLERQKGGIGLRGPGETQLETDRRLLGNRIKQLQKRLDKIKKQRSQGRMSRKKAEVPTVALVGYTNAGKSTLFNAMTSAGVFVADQLFATLDPTLRKVDLPDLGSFILADTVGFIRNLPHDLVESFRSTLQETAEAHLLLHVIDAQDPEHPLHMQQVQEVLAEIGAQDVPQLKVYNKIDLLGEQPSLTRDEQGVPARLRLSAKKQQGIDLLLQSLSELLHDRVQTLWLEIPPSAFSVRSELYPIAQVLSEKYLDTGAALLQVRIREKDLNRLCKKAPIIVRENEDCLATQGNDP